MNNLNLRNWRDEKRDRKTEAYAKTNIAFFSLLMVFFAIMFLMKSSAINEQETINNMLKRENTILDADLEKIDNLQNQIDEIIERMEIINALQSNRSDIVILLDEIAEITPKEIRLTSIIREDNLIKIEGVSISPLYISDFLRKIKTSNILSLPKIDRVVADKKENGFERSKFYISAIEKKRSSLKENEELEGEE